MTSIAEMKLKCPCCRRRFKTLGLMSWNNLGPLSTDFHERARGFPPLPFFVHTCHRCGYSGYQYDFADRKVDRRLKKLVREKLTPAAKKERIILERKYGFAALIAEWRGDAELDISELYLRAAWICDDDRKKEEEKLFRIKTIEHFEYAFQKNEITEKDVGRVSYLIGENYRRIGDWEKTHLWYDRAINALGKDPEKKCLLHLAIQQKSNPKEFIRE